VRLGAAIALVAVLGACRTPPFGDEPFFSNDGSTASDDLARAPDCTLLLDCMQRCALTTNPETAQPCFEGCQSFENVTPGSSSLAGVGETVREYCLGVAFSDTKMMQPAACVFSASGELVDRDGRAKGSCAACVHDVLSNLMSLPCDKTHPACDRSSFLPAPERYCHD